MILVPLLLLVASPSPASPPLPPPRQEIFRMVDAYIVSNLQESLGLTDEQFAKLIPLVKRVQKNRREFNQKRQAIIRELRTSFQAGTATEARVGELMKELKALEVEGPQSLKKDQDAIDAALNPVQQAKYRVLEFNVDQRIRGLMGRLGRPPRREEPEAPREP